MEAMPEAMSEGWESALAIVAHPDDLEYGTASAIARWTSQGKKITYVMVSSGEAGIDGMHPDEAGPLREREEQASAEVVGVDEVEFLRYKDGVIEYGLPLRMDLARVIRRHRPEVVITQGHGLTRGGETLVMSDHRVVGLAVLDAIRDAANRWIFTELLDEGLEPWNGVQFACASAGGPGATHYVDVTDHIERGVAALAEHKAYFEGLGRPFDPSWMYERAKSTGERFGCEYALGFSIVRF